MTVNSIQANVRLGVWRVALDCALSSGLYIFYWLYLTWKQLREETGETHYPVWHALALFVPIYGWFVVYRHLETIKELQVKVDIRPLLNPSGLLVLAIIANVLYLVVGRFPEMTWVIFFDVIGTALLVAFFIVSQNHLNKYWEHTKGTQLRDARIGVGEVIFVLIGLILWSTYLL